jgi:hypothetical protein
VAYLFESILFGVCFSLDFEDLTKGALAELADDLEIFKG